MSNLSRLSLNTATTKHLTLAEAIKAAQDAGLGGIGAWRDRVQEAGVDEAARMLADSGLAVTSLCRGGFLTATGEAEKQAALDDNKRAIDEAQAIGTKELVMVVGGVPASFESMDLASSDASQREIDRKDKDIVAARERVTEKIAELVPYAAQAGVRLALEPMHPLFTADRGVLTTIDQALEIAAPFAAEEVGVVVDTYHVWWDPALAEAIKKVGEQDRFSSYQICDWVLPLAENSLNSRGFMGDGYIDFETISKWVGQTGYDGLVEVEIFNESIWAQPAADTIQRMAEGFTELVLPNL